MIGDPGKRHTLVLGGLAVRRADPEVECRPHDEVEAEELAGDA
jgi:hypothetical protein